MPLIRLGPRDSSPTGGFTMVELLAVVTIMGLMAGIVALSWAASLPRAELNSTVHDLAAAVSGARSDAIARNGIFRIYYDLDANSYSVSSPYRFGGGLARTDEERLILKRMRLPESVDMQLVTIGGMRYESGVVYVSFDPLGSATGHTVTLMQSTSDVPLTIEVLPLTGLIRFHYDGFERPIMTAEDFD
ncbi:MAG: GspH/FimT family pseudopilin [bacterium]|jgi:prepilin-type N-terminal cleavage/methylation domain-containing protein